MRVVGRGRDGDWLAWRVGRMRLAWRPIPRRRDAPWPGLLENRRQQREAMAEWIEVLLRTPAALFRRARTGQWPVIAYLIMPLDGDVRQRSTEPVPRAEADDLVRRWAEDIRAYGEPQYPGDDW